MTEATDAATFDWHGLSITIAPAGFEGSNSNLSTRGYRGGGLYTTATGVPYRNLYAMLAGYQDLSIAEAEMFGKALAAIRETEDRHNPPPVIEPQPGIVLPPAPIQGTVLGKYHVRMHPEGDATRVELEVGPEWHTAHVPVPFERAPDAVAAMSNRRQMSDQAVEDGELMLNALNALYEAHRPKKAKP